MGSARVHGICEEYRAAATLDVEHDRADKKASRRIECPMLRLWAEGGPLLPGGEPRRHRSSAEAVSLRMSAHPAAAGTS